MGTTGLHNTLEAAVFGVPIIIGNNYNKFPEASTMIKNRGMFSISNKSELEVILNKLIKNEDFRINSGKINSTYISENKGAVTQIMAYLNKS